MELIKRNSGADWDSLITDESLSDSYIQQVNREFAYTLQKKEEDFLCEMLVSKGFPEISDGIKELDASKIQGRLKRYIDQDSSEIYSVDGVHVVTIFGWFPVNTGLGEFKITYQLKYQD